MRNLTNTELSECLNEACVLLTLDFNQGKEYGNFEKLPNESINKIKKYSLEHFEVFGNPEVTFRITTKLFNSVKFCNSDPRVKGPKIIKALILNKMSGVTLAISKEGQEFYKIFKELI
jgi:hypothetical protein